MARTLTAAHKELAAADPVMGELIERLGARSVESRRRGLPKPDAYGALLRTVVAQQVSSKAARAIYQRVLDLFGGATPSPDQILGATEADLRGAGLSGRKVSYIRDLAAHVRSGELELDRLDQLSDEEVIEEIPSPHQVLEIAERWRPHRSLASIYLWESLVDDVTVGGT